MLSETLIKDILSSSDISRLEKILFILFLDQGNPKKLEEIRQTALHYGLREIRSWNLASILTKSKKRAIRTPTGWELTTSGGDCVSKLIPLDKTKSKEVPTKTDLHKQIPSIKSKDTQNFVEEAILSYDNKLYRSAVVLSWIGAISILYDFVVMNRLADFNSEAIKRYPQWKAAKNADDLSRMKERHFLDILEACSIIGKSVKIELIGCLDLRNGCGHPNSLKIGQARVAAHIETLVLNVFSKFS